MNFKVGDIILYNKRQHFLIMEYRAELNYFCWSYTVLCLDSGQIISMNFYNTDNMFIELVA